MGGRHAPELMAVLLRIMQIRPRLLFQSLKTNITILEVFGDLKVSVMENARIGIFVSTEIVLKISSVENFDLAY